MDDETAPEAWLDEFLEDLLETDVSHDDQSPTVSAPRSPKVPIDAYSGGTACAWAAV